MFQEFENKGYKLEQTSVFGTGTYSNLYLLSKQDKKYVLKLAKLEASSNRIELQNQAEIWKYFKEEQKTISLEEVQKHLNLFVDSAPTLKVGSEYLFPFVLPFVEHTAESYFSLPLSKTLWKWFATQAMRCLELLHFSKYVHGDLSLGNFGISNHQVCLLDFGLSWIPFATRKRSVPFGTLLFSSAQATMGIRPSYDDDKESLVYLLAYLWEGKLPWSEEVELYKTKPHKSVLQRIWKMKQEAFPKLQAFIRAQIDSSRSDLCTIVSKDESSELEQKSFPKEH